MKEETIDIPTKAGRMETFVTRPEQAGPFHAVILFMDVWGVREVLFDLARRVATVGYYVLVPDFYYRQGRIRTDYRDEKGNAISLKNLTPEQSAAFADAGHVFAVPLHLKFEVLVRVEALRVDTELSHGASPRP